MLNLCRLADNRLSSYIGILTTFNVGVFLLGKEDQRKNAEKAVTK